ncbi:metabolite transport protein GIT1 [Xylaria sp. CBS 124048]|nr:metabolite transport protein GIT1 [Xylaria sp. CBS 124048]
MATKDIAQVDFGHPQDHSISKDLSVSHSPSDEKPKDGAQLEEAGSRIALTPAQARKAKRSAIFTVFCSGFALFSDGYQNSLMTATNIVLTHSYKQYTTAFSTQVSNALTIGEILGQITVGLVCDYYGRKWAILITTATIVIGGILATAASASTPVGIFWFLTVARGIVGFGTGGEYPASSVSATEAANERLLKHRGPVFLSVTSLPLSIGGILVLCVFLIVLSIAGENHLNTVWRVCFGIGVIWPLSVFYFRWKMLNSKLYRRGAIKKRVPYKLILKYYWKTMIGTCGSWFIYDFVSAPNGTFAGLIIDGVVHNTEIRTTLEWTLLLSAIALPGLFLGMWLCDRVGRKGTMMLGFGGYLVFGLIVGLAYNKVIKIVPLFVVLYAVMQSLGGMGPGNMEGLVSSESYATAVRGTCYGISAACGKAGAVVGVEVFTHIQTNLGKRWTFIIAAIAGLVGVLITWIFIPNLTTEDLSKNDERFRAYLVANGWYGMMGEADLQARADEARSIRVSQRDAPYEDVATEKRRLP